MSYNCSSGNFSSHSLGGYQVPIYDAFYSSNVVHTPSTCQVGSSNYNYSQENFYGPTSFQTPGFVGRSFQTSCYHPGYFILCSPCQTNFPESLGFGNIGLGSLGYGNTGFQSLHCGSNSGCPTYFSSRSHQLTCN
ncbi:keratin-associated protein 15-1 [Loxodonta africana]|uniref:keratin-associated protein 15-1 n=1 Tax=Loxodonta africana TaxID=9785 RepID=UPI0000E32AC7|nr:keratin-associated protein 15-1 [Loxodonta africana]